MEDISRRFAERREAGADPYLAVFLHSLAFGTTLSYVASDPGRREVTPRQLEMTADVMAHSMVYWVRDLFHAGLLGNRQRVFAMTSEGATRVVPSYGPVSAAKAALESHVRQLALELIPHGITVNAIRAGVTDTPALAASPAAETRAALRHSTRAAADAAGGCRRGVHRAPPSTHLHWMTDVIGVDGGEAMSAARRRFTPIPGAAARSLVTCGP